MYRWIVYYGGDFDNNPAQTACNDAGSTVTVFGPAPTPTPTPNPDPTAEPTPGPSVEPSFEPTPGPSGGPTSTPQPTPQPTPQGSPTPAPTPDPNPPAEATSGTTAYTTTYDGGDLASVHDPVNTAVQWPATVSSGTTTIAESAAITQTPPAGYTLLGQQVDITAPSGTASNPLSLVFFLDASIIPTGEDETTIVVLRNGVPVPNCDPFSSGVADPDPCVYFRYKTFEGDIVLAIYTSAASHWNFSAAPVFNYVFNGFFAPVDNLPILNVAKAGSAIPVKFGLGGYQGLGIFAPGYPISHPASCDAAGTPDVIETTVTAGGSGLSYAAGADRYTYVWKTSKSWAGSCRQLVVKLVDGSYHYANFKFK